MTLLTPILLLLGALSAPASTNLVSNGDFSADTQGIGWPDDWGKPAPGMSWELEEGKRFLRLVSQSPGQTLMAYREIPIPEGTKGIEINIRYRTAGVQRGSQPWFDARTMAHFLDAARKQAPPSPKPIVFSTKAATWTEGNVRALVPPGAKILQLMPSLFQVAAGTLDLAEIRVSPLDSAALEGLAAAAAEAERKKAEKLAQTLEKNAAKVSAQLAETGSLVANGDFKLDTKGRGWPDGWGGKPSDELSWESEGDARFIRLNQRQPGKMLMLYHLVPLPSGIKGLELSMRYRTAGVKQGEKSWFDARTILHFKDAEGRQMKPTPAPLIFSRKASDWTVGTSKLIVPPGAVQLEMMPALFQVAAGTLDLGEIRVAPMKDADAEAMIAASDAAAKKKAERAAIIAAELGKPQITKEIKVSGNKLVTVDGGKEVWLQGLSVDSMQWGPGDNILWSIKVGIDEWKANVIRLPVNPDAWAGRGIKGNMINPDTYRQLVDDAVRLCATRGAYLVLDLHEFGAPRAKHVEFWKDAAARYKNNPAVLFEIFNEPHGISWKIWRDGGSLKSPDNKITDVNPIENTEKQDGDMTVGAQALVAAVRGTGARNIVVSGALDWAYDLSGILKGFALDDLGGNGVMYVSHIYPWKSGWQEKVLAAAAVHPVIITEVGCPRRWEDFSFIGPSQRRPLEGWSENCIGMMQKYKLHWTGFSFHPTCGPQILLDWDYNPTPYWGVFVKEALAGKTFEMKEMQ